MVTKEQAMTATVFHLEGCSRRFGTKGGEYVDIKRYRRNGTTQTWKTRPDHFRIPTKFGLKYYGDITHDNARFYHTEQDCPLNAEEG